MSGQAKPIELELIQDVLEAKFGVTIRFKFTFDGVRFDDQNSVRPTVRVECLATVDDPVIVAAQDNTKQGAKNVILPTKINPNSHEPLPGSSKHFSNSPMPDEALANRWKEEKFVGSIAANNKEELPMKANMRLPRHKLEIGPRRIESCLSVDDSSNSTLVGHIVHDLNELIELSDHIGLLAQARKFDDLPQLARVAVGQVVMVKSMADKNWYRAQVVVVAGAAMAGADATKEEHDDGVRRRVLGGQLIRVYLFDWGIHELVPLANIKPLTCDTIGLINYPACSIKVCFQEMSPAYRHHVKSCERPFKMLIKSYHHEEDSYEVQVVEISK